MKKLVIVVLVLCILSIPSFALKKTWDDFEDGTFNSTKWLATGGAPNPTINTSFSHDGSNSLEIPAGKGILNGTPFWDNNGFSGEYVISMYVYSNKNTFIGGLNDHFRMAYAPFGPGGIVGSNTWNYDDAGWQDSGISSISGSYDMANDWVLIRMIVNDTNNSATLFLGNVSEELELHQWSTPTGQSSFFRAEPGGAGGGILWVDTIEMWDTATHGSDGVEIVTETEPTDPVVTIVFPESARLYNTGTIDINLTIETDEISEVSQIDIYINGTLNKTVALGNTSLTLDDGLYDLSVNVTTNQSLYGIDSVPNWKIDTVNPFDDLLIQLPDSSSLIKSQNTTITAFNTNLYGHNVTLWSGTDIIESAEILNISAPEHSIITHIDLSVLGVGSFRVVSNESDDHTDNIIPNYERQHSTLNKNILFNTGTAEVMVQLQSAEMKIGGSPFVPIASPLLTNVYSSKMIDRYTFGFTFNHPTADLYRYTFKILSDRDIYYREGSGYQGHFVIGENWLDFEPYEITVSHDGQFFYIQFETTDQDISFESIGGVNFASTESTFTVPAPAGSGIECAIGEWGTCAGSDSQVLDSVRGTCDDSLSASFIVINETNSHIFDQGQGTNISTLFSFNHTDVTLQENDIITINVTCINDASSSIASSQFTVSAQPVIEPEDTSNPFGAILGSAVIVLLLIVILVSLYNQYIGGKK